MGMAVDAVKRAKSLCDDVEFSPMDATRTESGFLYRILEATIDAGATTVNIPDTVGYSNPEEFGALIKGVFDNVPNIDKATVSVHCHNDLGLAAANSLAAVENGARQVEGCINGLGERAGNASLEEVMMALETRYDHYGVKSDVNTREIGPSSRLVADLFGFAIQPNKAIGGQNAFRHRSGIHQDAYLKERTTFEIMEPESVGWRGEAIVMGKLSGRAGLRSRLGDLRYELNDPELADLLSRYPDLTDQQRDVPHFALPSLLPDRHPRPATGPEARPAAFGAAGFSRMRDRRPGAPPDRKPAERNTHARRHKQQKADHQLHVRILMRRRCDSDEAARNSKAYVVR